MADHGILFSAPMVRALLAGTKTQTRRLLSEARVFATPETKAFTLRGDDLARALQNASGFRRLDGNGWFWESDAFEWQAPALRTGWMAHIGYAPGDRLWVREAWRTWRWNDRLKPSATPAEWGRRLHDFVQFEADNDNRMDGRLRASMHLPRAFSRLTLIVTDVRVQRLQDISEEDARAEGIVPLPSGRFHCGFDDEGEITSKSAITAYAWLWNAINGEDAWSANPWVVAYTFTVHQQNIDAMEKAA